MEDKCDTLLLILNPLEGYHPLKLIVPNFKLILITAIIQIIVSYQH